MSIQTPAPARTQPPPSRGPTGLAGLAATLLTLLTALLVPVALLLAPLLLLVVGALAYPLLRSRRRSADRPRPSAPSPSVPSVPVHRFGSGAW